MSLFFLILSGITYFLTHARAKKTKPNRKLYFLRPYLLTSNKDELRKVIKERVNKEKNLSLVSQESNYYLINKRASLFSFGTFFHVTFKEASKCTDIELLVQEKLIGARHRKLKSEDLFKDFEIKDAG